MYVQTLSIRNYSNRARRVRIDGPSQKGPFSLQFTPGTSLAPGLETTCDVTFSLPQPTDEGVVGLEEGVFRDSVTVHFGNGELSVKVPLVAATPQANVLAVPTPPRGQRQQGSGATTSSAGVGIPATREAARNSHNTHATRSAPPDSPHSRN